MLREGHESGAATSGHPLVTIVTPSYNQAQFLPECIESVLSQDYPYLEYIIMDGGSTDGSDRVVQRYDKRVAYWESRPDGGQSDAINRGWEKGSGEILSWMNADDAYLPGAVSAAAEYLNCHPDIDIVYGDYFATNEQGEVVDAGVPVQPFDASALMFVDYIPSGSTFIRRSVLRRIGPLDVTLRFVMDWDYWIRASVCCRFAYLPQRLSTFRIHPAARTWSNPAARAVEIARLAERLTALPDSEGRPVSARKQASGRLLVAAAQNAFAGGATLSGFEDLWRSVLAAPLIYNRSRARTLADLMIRFLARLSGVARS